MDSKPTDATTNSARLRKRLTRYAAVALKSAAWVGFGIIKWQAIWGKPPLYTGDGRVWAEIAESPLFSIDFFAARRPFLMPLLYKLVGGSDEAIIRLQLVLSILAWGALAHALSRLVRGLPSVLVFLGVLLSGLATPIHAWDLVIRAESSSLSALALMIAALIHFLLAVASRPIVLGIWAGICAILAFFTANARDTNGYILLLLAGVVAVALFLGRHFIRRAAKRFAGGPRRHRWAFPLGATGVILAVLGSTGFAQWSSREALRYDFPLMNVIFQRVLPDDTTREYFVNQLGMPMSDALMTRKRKWASANRRYAFRSPELQDFRTWLATSAYSGYQRYLLAHFPATWVEAYDHFSGVLAFKPGRTGAARTPLSDWTDDLATSGPLVESPGAWSAAAAVIGAISFCFRSYRTRLAGTINLALVIAVLSQLYISYHADAMEVHRHSVAVGMLLRLSLVLSLGLLVSAITKFLARTLGPSVRAGLISRFVHRRATATVGAAGEGAGRRV